MGYLDATWSVLVELAPWLLLGALVSGALHALLPAGFVRRALRGRSGVLKAVALGVPLPLCSCGVIPAAVGLRKDGASPGSALGFLIATPQTGVDSVFVSGAMLGWPFALFKLVSAFALGLVGGFATDALVPDEVEAPERESEGGRPGLGAGLHHAVDVVRMIWRWLVLGVLASAALHVFLPAEALAAFGEGTGGTLLALGAALVLSLPLYVCATASVPIAAALVAGGFPPGAALVFLMAGPATNVATLGAVRSTFGGRATALYLSTLVVGSLGLGALFDFVLPTRATVHHEHGEPSLLGVGASIVLLAMIAFFVVEELRAFLGRASAESDGNAAIEVAVEGLTCNGCVRKLERSLTDAGLRVIFVRREPKGRARVEGAPVERLRELIRDAGFDSPLDLPRTGA